MRKFHHYQPLVFFFMTFKTILVLYICTLSLMLIFLLKTHLYLVGFIPLDESTKVYTWLVDMKFISHFMTLSHLSRSILDIASI